MSQDSSAEPTPGRTSVGVAVTTATWDAAAAAIEVSAYASVVADGGSCVVTATHGDVQLSTTSDALADVSTTSCGLVSLSDPRLMSGDWQVTVTYRSPVASGTSAPTTIRIP